MTGTTAFTIARATPRDAARVAALAARLFTQAYGPTHPEPELSRYLERSFAIARLTAEMAESSSSFLVVRDAAGVDIGYAHVREPAERPDGVRGVRPVEIARFYVEAGWHGRGVAQALMAACVAEARDRGGDVLWLQVWTRAPRPQAFYRRSGFQEVGRTTFRFGDRVDDDLVMARALEA